ncbi:MAG: SDR family NAD(P)-dependent oxidoreductase [Candidatus Portnoybacteria bacterium]
MKNILITGGAGFIGANFAYKFLDLGHNVHLIERQESDLWRLEKIKDKISLHCIDLKDYDQLEAFIAELKPEIILHFAAYGTYPRKQQDIKNTIDVNLLGTINLINACSKIKFECFINTGSSSEYGIKDKPMKEDDLLEANNLYGITKAASTMYCQYLAKKLDLPIATMRPFAVYGYFEEKERLIPVIIKSCLANSELKLASPSSVRDFIFIEDVIDAYLTVVKNSKEVKGEVFNLGTGKQSTVGEAVSIIQEITNSDTKPDYGQMKPAQLEPENWMADISKMKDTLKWQPRYSLREGLEKDIAWFKDNLALYKED